LLRERKGKGPRQSVKQLKLPPHCEQPREHMEGSITSSHQMGIILKRSSSLWLRQWRVRSADGLPAWLSQLLWGLSQNHSTLGELASSRVSSWSEGLKE